jgi:hypothetical protein
MPVPTYQDEPQPSRDQWLQVQSCPVNEAIVKAALPAETPQKEESK